jgi:hypothetical protein
VFIIIIITCVIHPPQAFCVVYNLDRKVTASYLRLQSHNTIVQPHTIPNNVPPSYPNGIRRPSVYHPTTDHHSRRRLTVGFDSKGCRTYNAIHCRRTAFSSGRVIGKYQKTTPRRIIGIRRLGLQDGRQIKIFQASIGSGLVQKRTTGTEKRCGTSLGDTGGEKGCRSTIGGENYQ